jgi:hypothetical protein
MLQQFTRELATHLKHKRKFLSRTFEQTAALAAAEIAEVRDVHRCCWSAALATLGPTLHPEHFGFYLTH